MKERKIFHLHFLENNTHEYYGSLKAIFDSYNDLGVSKYKLDRWDFAEPFTNNKIELRKSVLRTTVSIKRNDKL